VLTAAIKVTTSPPLPLSSSLTSHPLDLSPSPSHPLTLSPSHSHPLDLSILYLTVSVFPPLVYPCISLLLSQSLYLCLSSCWRSSHLSRSLSLPLSLSPSLSLTVHCTEDLSGSRRGQVT